MYDLEKDCTLYDRDYARIMTEIKQNNINKFKQKIFD